MEKLTAVYAKTLRAWLKKIDLNKNTAIKVLANDHGVRDGKTQWRRWRIFFMACEELFRFKEEMNGTYVTIV